jgi:hypothetical protein
VAPPGRKNRPSPPGEPFAVKNNRIEACILAEMLLFSAVGRSGFNHAHAVNGSILRRVPCPLQVDVYLIKKPIMEITTTSSINGACEGFKKDRVFELLNGAKWQQTVENLTLHKSSNAVAQIWTEHKRNYLAIIGMTSMVEVKQI